MAFCVPERYRVTTGPLGTAANVGHYGAFDVESPEPGWRLALICDDGTDGDVPESLGWEHVSVHAYRARKVDVTALLRPDRVPQTRTPTWKEMAFVKSLCWEDEDVVVQYHPRKSEYVNAHPNVLHLWCVRGHAFPTPPPNLVGPLRITGALRT